MKTETALELNNNSAVCTLYNPLKVEAQLFVPSVFAKCEPDTLADEKARKKKSCRHRFGGILFALLATLFFSFVTCFAKLLANYHPFCIAFWRQFGNLIPSVPLVLYFQLYRKQNLFDGIWPLACRRDVKSGKNWSNLFGLWTRAFLGCNMVLLKFYGIEYLTIADFTVISNGGPIFTIVLGHFVLKEKCGVVPIFVSFFCLAGVAVISRPPFLTGASTYDVDLLIGIGIVLLVEFFNTISNILMRRVRKIHFVVMTLIFGVWGIVQSSIAAISFGVFSVPSGLQDQLLMAGLALFSFLGQTSMILALKIEEAGTVSLVRTSDVIIIFILQAIILRTPADIFSVIGACIIVIGVFIIAFRKWLSSNDEKSFARRYFWFLLM